MGTELPCDGLGSARCCGHHRQVVAWSNRLTLVRRGCGQVSALPAGRAHVGVVREPVDGGGGQGLGHQLAERSSSNGCGELDRLLALLASLAEHRIHLRTTYPIESTLATVRHRTTPTRGLARRRPASRWR